MNHIDMHLSPVIEPDLERLTETDPDDLLEATRHHGKRLEALGGEQAVLVVFNSDILDEDGIGPVMDEIREDGRFVPAYMPPLETKTPEMRVDRAREAGFRILKLHPYIQSIESADHGKAVALAEAADQADMPVMVCGSYGTRDLDRHDGVRIAADVADAVDVPVILSHAGGAQLLDAMLAAEDLGNLYLETSFTLPYYVDSSIERDLAFAMRKLGTDRWLYGSDAPFVGIEESLEETRSFFSRHDFIQEEIEDVLYRTGRDLLAPLT